jgi:hypothetical protein
MRRSREAGRTAFPGGYLGIGLDSYGNYANPQFDPPGCTTQPWEAFAPNQVTVRGPGDGQTG